MKWPETSTCHGSNEFSIWRDPNPEPKYSCDCGYESIGTYGYPFRTCAYCGSINTEDLAGFLQKPGVMLQGTDWKYQVPHKFYVTGIANPLAGKPVDISSSHSGFDHEPTTAEINERISEFTRYLVTPESVFVKTKPHPNFPGSHILHLHGRSPGPADTFTKFYTLHLEDAGYDEEAHDLILKLVSEHSGIDFTRAGVSPIENSGFAVHYKAPSFGYQRY